MISGTLVNDCLIQKSSLDTGLTAVSPVSDYIKCAELTVTYIKVLWLSNGRSVTPKSGRGLL